MVAAPESSSAVSPASTTSPRTMKRLWEWQPPPFTTAVDTAVARKEEVVEEEEAVRTPHRSALRPEPGRRWVGPTTTSEEGASPDNSPNSGGKQRVGGDAWPTTSPRVLSARYACAVKGHWALRDRAPLGLPREGHEDRWSTRRL
jgi:hypothetical protein